MVFGTDLSGSLPVRNLHFLTTLETGILGTAIAFTFNAPRFVASAGPLLAGTLIVGFGGYGPAATVVGLLFLPGFLVAPFLPETRGKPLPEPV